MSLPVEVLRALLERGVDPEAILAAAEASEAHAKAQAAAAKAEAEAREEERLARRRQSNRERQARYYARHFCDNADNAVIARDNASNAVMQREEREDHAAKGPQTPKNSPEDITPSLPSEAQPPLPAKPRRFEWPSDFEDRFWAVYPRHTDRKKAMAALGKIRRADRVDFAEIIAGCDRLRASGTEDRFLPHPTTWLNNERWTDVLPDGRPPTSRAPPLGRGNGFGNLASEKRAARQTGDGDGNATQHHADRPVPSAERRTAGPPEGHARGGFGDGPGEILDLVPRRAYG